MGENKSFGGRQLRYRHSSSSLICDIYFSNSVPPPAHNARVRVWYWLSGLTGADENFVTKAGAQQHAAKQNVAIVAPHTSPREERVLNDPNGAYDFGLEGGRLKNIFTSTSNISPSPQGSSGPVARAVPAHGYKARD